MDNATKRPWKLILPMVEEEGEETDEGGMVGVIMGDRIDSPGNYTVGNEIRLDEDCCLGDNEVAEANARLIVKAVNCHDELVAALKIANSMLAVSTWKYSEDASLFLDGYKVIEQALSKAGESPEDSIEQARRQVG